VLVKRRNQSALSIYLNPVLDAQTQYHQAARRFGQTIISHCSRFGLAASMYPHKEVEAIALGAFAFIGPSIGAQVNTQ